MKETGKSITIAIMLLTLALIPANIALAWNPTGCPGRGVGMAQQATFIKQRLNLDQNQSRLWDQMRAASQALRQRCLQQGDNLVRETRFRNMVRARSLLRAELAAANPDFKSLGEKLKSEYQGNLKTEYNLMIDARVAFYSSLSQAQRDLLLRQQAKRGRGNGRNNGGCRNGGML